MEDQWGHIRAGGAILHRELPSLKVMKVDFENGRLGLSVSSGGLQPHQYEVFAGLLGQ